MDLYEELGNLIRLTGQYIKKEYGLLEKPPAPPAPPAQPAKPAFTKPLPTQKKVAPPLIDEKPPITDVKEQLAALKNFYPGLKMVDTVPSKSTALFLLRHPHPFYTKMAEALEKRGVTTTFSTSLSDLSQKEISLYLVEKPLSITQKPVIYLEAAEQYESQIELKKALWEELKIALHL